MTVWQRLNLAGKVGMAPSVVALPAGPARCRPAARNKKNKKQIRWKSSEKAPSPSQVDRKFLPKGRIRKRTRIERNMEHWAQKRWRKSHWRRGGAQTPTNNFSLSRYLFFLFWPNIFNPPVFSPIILCVWNMSEECRLCMACICRCTPIPIDCVGFSCVCVYNARGSCFVFQIYLVIGCCLSFIQDRSTDFWNVSLYLEGEWGDLFLFGQVGVSFFTVCSVCVCVSLVGCTSCLFHRLSRSARVALTFELFLGFFQLFFDSFWDFTTPGVCVFSRIRHI